MQNDLKTIQREALRLLPSVLAELLDEERVDLHREDHPNDRGIDLLAKDAQGRRWAIEIKNSSRPGQVDRAAAQLHRLEDEDLIPLLVVPYMSKAGAETADRRGLNWVDLSGNAHIREEGLHIRVQGRPDRLRAAGRPSSPFAPKSARITRTLLLDPARWWRQKDLVGATGLDDGNVSRIVRRLEGEALLERRERELRPRDPDLLLDAWAQDYRFDRHAAVLGHLSGGGIEIAKGLDDRLADANVRHAFTGLPAAWAMTRFARFRLTSVFVVGDPRSVAAEIEMRQGEKGANVQLLEPDDEGVFAGEGRFDDLPCVAPVQAYVDLLSLPERSREAADHLRAERLNWRG
jgi:transcriptional regulator with AbiEi antitoxin domain of type IV toxin-antitoxin system